MNDSIYAICLESTVARAVLAERKRCAKIVREHGALRDLGVSVTLETVAEAIESEYWG